MMKILLWITLFFSFNLLSCSQTSSSGPGPDNASSSSGSGFVAWNAVEGYLAPDGAPMLLKGMAFGNQVWTANEPDPNHHTEEDFTRLRGMGLNAVRFYLSYKFFEEDAQPFQYKESGWAWLDTNIAWAERQDIYLILNIHVPQGGFQSNGAGADLWDIPANQDRLTALWFEIARRYAQEPRVAAYDLLNEPVVSQNKEQWRSLAQRLIDTIRTADTSHILFVERLNGIIGKAWSNDADMNFLSVNDPYGRTGLTFHYYGPFEYTHQYASWTILANQDGGNYPDSTRVQIGPTNWETATFSSPAIDAGNSDWKYYTGAWYKVEDTTMTNVARPTLACRAVQEGTVWYDSLVVEEQEPSGGIRTLATYELPGLDNWYLWTEKDGGEAREDSEESAVSITGTVADANYSTPHMYFTIKPGYRYRASGKMKGQSVPESAECRIRLDLEYTGLLERRNKAYLEKELAVYDSVARARGIPAYLGEFGTIRYTMTPEKGGVRWVSDMLDILEDRGISYTYHSWHEDAFGVYYGHGAIDPADANQELIDLFTQKNARP